MEKQEFIAYWVKTSENDLFSMESVFNTGKYDWSLFIGHLAVEKILKALWVKNNSENFPPKSHNLKKIADEAKFKALEDQSILLLELNDFNLEARYPDYKFDFNQKCTKDFAMSYIQKIKELHKCILELI